MARITIDGIGIEYELLGNSGQTIVLTPGGRFSKDTPGLRELGEALVAGGKRALIWDRPNCGASDICFDGPSESEVGAETLAGLVRALELGPVVLAAGSAGSRLSLIAASRHPDLVTHLVLWWISGGALGLMQLAYGYCCEAANTASMDGMEGVAAMPGFAENIAKNPNARAQLLAETVPDFIEKMQRWAIAYRPSDVSPVPGMTPEHFAALTMPTLILRSGESDVSHTRATTDKVHAMIPHSRMIDPPWPDEEWNDRLSDFMKGKAPGLFLNWPVLAPVILDFVE